MTGEYRRLTRLTDACFDNAKHNVLHHRYGQALLHIGEAVGYASMRQGAADNPKDQAEADACLMVLQQFAASLVQQRDAFMRMRGEEG